MQNYDVMQTLIAVIPMCFTFWLASNQAIKAWERVQEKRDAERIEAVVDRKFDEKLDEMKRNYTEMIQLLKSGTFK